MENSDKPQPLIGRVLKGAYRLDSKLGEGGMGAVYRATQLTVDREVAVKVLRASVLKEDAMAAQMRARFLREAKLTSKLEHPNTVRLIDFGETEDDGMLFLVLELLRGQELSKAMHRERLSPQRVARIGRQMCQSLSEAHARGIIHRDLKPDNVFLCEYHGVKDHVKIVDFGIARIVGGKSEETSQLTATGLIIGTPKYMAPEQVQGLEITAQTDLYALGVMLYEMLLGKAPFHAESVMALAFKHVHEEPEPVPDSFGHGWQSIITQLLAKHPAARPTNADVVASILSTLESDQGGAFAATGTDELPRGGPVAEETLGGTDGWQDEKTKGTGKGVLLAIAAGLLLTLGGVAAVVMGGDERPPVVAVGDTAGKPESPANAPPSKSAAGKTGDKSVEEGLEEGEGDNTKTAPVAVDAKATNETAADAAPAVEAPEVEAPSPVAPEPSEVVPTKKVRLALKSTPPGASVVRANKSLLCVTPCDLVVDATAGREQVLFQLPGHLPQTLSIALQAGGSVSESVVLAKRAELPTVVQPPPPSPATLPKTTAKRKAKAKARRKKPSVAATPMVPPVAVKKPAAVVKKPAAVVKKSATKKTFLGGQKVDKNGKKVGGVTRE